MRVCAIPGAPWVFSLALAITHLAVNTHAHTLTNGRICPLISQIPQHVCTRMHARKHTHTYCTLWFETVSVMQWQSLPGAISYVCQHISAVAVMPFCQMCFRRKVWRFTSCSHVMHPKFPYAYFSKASVPAVSDWNQNSSLVMFTVKSSINSHLLINTNM